jgi:hypothetical protein
MQTMQKHVLCHVGDRAPDTITPTEWEAVLLPNWERQLGYKTSVHVNAIYERMIKIDPQRFPNGNPIAVVVEEILPEISKYERDDRKVSHGALPFSKVASLYALCAAQRDDCHPAKALQLLLLTCCPRTAEIRDLSWFEINVELARIELAPHRVKGRHPHVIPLCAEALTLIERLRTARGDLAPDDYVFPGRKGKWVKYEGTSRKRVGGTWIPFAGHMQSDAMRVWFQATMPGVDAENGKPWDAFMSGSQAAARVIDGVLAGIDRFSMEAQRLVGLASLLRSDAVPIKPNHGKL